MPREIFEAVQARRRAELRSALVGILPASEKQLILEIGCGNGHFLTAYASAHPEQLCIGSIFGWNARTRPSATRSRRPLGSAFYPLRGP